MRVSRKPKSAVVRSSAGTSLLKAPAAAGSGLDHEHFASIDGKEVQGSGVIVHAEREDESGKSGPDDEEGIKDQYRIAQSRRGAAPADSPDGISSVYFFDPKKNSPFVYPMAAQNSPVESTVTSMRNRAYLRFYHPKHITPRRWENAERVRLRAVVGEQLKQNAIRSDDISNLGSSSNSRTSVASIVLNSDRGGSAIDWTLVSRELGSGHTAMECLMQYRNIEEPLLKRLAADKVDTRSSSRSNVLNRVDVSLLRAEVAWTADEAQRLRDHVQRYGDCDWVRCSDIALRGLRSPLECIQYYQQYVNNALIRNDNWTEEEDASLRLAVRIYDFHWHHVSDAINGRTPAQCKYRWDALCTEEERSDAKAIEGGRALVGNEDKGESKGRAVQGGRWDAEEERRLVLAAIALQAPVAIDSNRAERKRPADERAGRGKGSKRGRRAASSSSSNADVSISTASETRQSNEGVAQDGEPGPSMPRDDSKRAFLGWDAVAQFVPHRNAVKCREKWVNVLDPTINRDEFTPEEDKLLIELASARLRRSSDDSSEAAATASEQRSKMAGRGSKIWSDIAQHFSGRTDNHVYRRWKQLCPKEAVLDYLSSQHVKRQFEPAAHGR